MSTLASPMLLPGPAQQVALAGGDAQLAQRAQLLGRLQALGDGHRTLAGGEVHQRAQHRSRGVVLGAILHQREIDLHDVEAHLAEQPQAGVAGADVVGGEAHAGMLQGRHVAAQTVEVGDGLALGQLDDDPPRADLVARQDLQQPRGAEVLHLQRLRREVDGHDLVAVDARAAGGHDLEAGQVELDGAAGGSSSGEELAGVGEG